MRLLYTLVIVTMVSCEKSDFQEAPESKGDEAAKELLSTEDQIRAAVTVRPLRGRVAYEITIKNLGSEILSILSEPVQQWQLHEFEARLWDHGSWYQNITSRPWNRVVYLGPGGEFRSEAEPNDYAAIVRFGFGLVYKPEIDHRIRRDRLAACVWSEARSPEIDFGFLFEAADSSRTKAEQGGADQRSKAWMLARAVEQSFPELSSVVITEADYSVEGEGEVPAPVSLPAEKWKITGYTNDSGLEPLTIINTSEAIHKLFARIYAETRSESFSTESSDRRLLVNLLASENKQYAQDPQEHTGGSPNLPFIFQLTVYQRGSLVGSQEPER